MAGPARSSPKKRIQTAEYPDYAEKWNTFAYFVYFAVLWPFYGRHNAQFLATKCKKAAKPFNHGFHGWHGERRGEREEGRWEMEERKQQTAGASRGPPEV